jgi:hypothetical protein
MGAITIRFAKPKVLFQFTRLDPDRPELMTAVGSNGKQAWFYKRGYNAGVEERPLEQIYGTIEAGQDSVLMLMLLTNTNQDYAKDDYVQTVLKPDENVSGKPCSVVAERGLSGAEERTWIEKSTHMILRTDDGLSGIRINYHPQPNVEIKDSELTFQNRL